MPFLLAEILNFQGSTHRYGVGSFSYERKKLGCGGLIFIIIIVYGFLNDIASYAGESLQIFMWIGIIIVICAIVKYIHDN